MELFKMGDVDFTKCIRMGTYKVNSKDVYNEWVDGNYKTHRDIVRSKVKGTFSLYFTDASKEEEFFDILNSITGTGGQTPVSVYVNNHHEVRDVEVFIDIDPSNEKPYMGLNKYGGFELSLEEA